MWFSWQFSFVADDMFMIPTKIQDGPSEFEL
jgi:hypothetical protein